MTLAEIREKRAAKVSAARAILAKAEGEKRSLNDEEIKAFDACKAEIESLEAQEKRAIFIEEIERRADVKPIDKPFQALQDEISVIEVMRSQMEGRAVSGAAAEYSKEVEQRSGRKPEGVFIPMSLLERRESVNTTTTAAKIVPTEHRPDLYIGPLREQLMARRLGVRVLTGLSGNLSIPKYGSGLETGWIAENSPVPEGAMSFASVGLIPNHVGGKTEMSRQLLQQSSPDIEGLCREDLAFLIAKQIDKAIIAGTGKNNEPLGVLNFAGKQAGTLATLNWLSVLQMVQQLEDEEIFTGTWLTNSTIKTTLASTLKEDKLPGYLLENGTLASKSLYVSRHIPASTIILGDWSQVLLGVWSELDILVNPYAEPAYSRGGVQVRAMATVGIAARHEKAFVVANDVE